jgi:hypothetical protein
MRTMPAGNTRNQSDRAREVTVSARDLGVSFAFCDRIAGLNPIGSEVVREYQDAEMGKAHISQRDERRTRIRAMSKRAAATIDDDIRGARERLAPLFQVIKSFRGGGGSVEGRAGNVSSFVERVESDANDSGRFGAGERFCQGRRVDCFCSFPRGLIILLIIGRGGLLRDCDAGNGMRQQKRSCESDSESRSG